MATNQLEQCLSAALDEFDICAISLTTDGVEVIDYPLSESPAKDENTIRLPRVRARYQDLDKFRSATVSAQTSISPSGLQMRSRHPGYQAWRSKLPSSHQLQEAARCYLATGSSPPSAYPCSQCHGCQVIDEDVCATCGGSGYIAAAPRLELINELSGARTVLVMDAISLIAGEQLAIRRTIHHHNIGLPTEWAAVEYWLDIRSLVEPLLANLGIAADEFLLRFGEDPVEYDHGIGPISLVNRRWQARGPTMNTKPVKPAALVQTARAKLAEAYSWNNEDQSLDMDDISLAEWALLEFGTLLNGDGVAVQRSLRYRPRRTLEVILNDLVYAAAAAGFSIGLRRSTFSGSGVGMQVILMDNEYVPGEILGFARDWPTATERAWLNLSDGYSLAVEPE